jgi:hypothetical protein
MHHIPNGYENIYTRSVFGGVSFRLRRGARVQNGSRHRCCLPKLHLRPPLQCGLRSLLRPGQSERGRAKVVGSDGVCQRVAGRTRQAGSRRRKDGSLRGGSNKSTPNRPPRSEFMSASRMSAAEMPPWSPPRTGFPSTPLSAQEEETSFTSSISRGGFALRFYLAASPRRGWGMEFRSTIATPQSGFTWRSRLIRSATGFAVPLNPAFDLSFAFRREFDDLEPIFFERLENFYQPLESDRFDDVGADPQIV